MTPPRKRNRTRTSESRAIAQIACPYCGSPPGTECTMVRRHPGPLCHQERRKANQERTRALAADLLRPGGTK